MSDQIKTPNGLPADFSKSPEDIANEINAKVDQIRAEQGDAAANQAVHELTEKANQDHRRAAEAINRDYVGERESEQEESPIEAFIQSFYSILTEQLKAILSAQVPVQAVLCQKPDGTLTIDVHPAKRVLGVDLERKIVHLAPETGVVEQQVAEAAAKKLQSTDEELSENTISPKPFCPTPPPLINKHVDGGECCGGNTCGENTQG